MASQNFKECCHDIFSSKIHSSLQFGFNIEFVYTKGVLWEIHIPESLKIFSLGHSLAVVDVLVFLSDSLPTLCTQTHMYTLIGARLLHMRWMGYRVSLQSNEQLYEGEQQQQEWEGSTFEEVCGSPSDGY